MPCPMPTVICDEHITAMSTTGETDGETSAGKFGNSHERFNVTFGKDFGVKFGDTEKQLLLLLNSNPALSAQNLADNLEITKRAVEKQIKKLRDLQILSRQGSAKNGLWVIDNKQ